MLGLDSGLTIAFPCGWASEIVAGERRSGGPCGLPGILAKQFDIN